jgi:hypothetical protein
MKAHKLAKLLLEHPDRDVIFWDGTDNWDVDAADPDDCNKVDLILTSTAQIK